MPFGPKNAPAVFQQMMNRALGKLLYKKACVYLDDIIVWGKTFEEVLQNTEEVIKCLR
jgi:orotate phosphoribosyltransferase-like protein